MIVSRYAVDLPLPKAVASPFTEPRQSHQRRLRRSTNLAKPLERHPGLCELSTEPEADVQLRPSTETLGQRFDHAAEGLCR